MIIGRKREVKDLEKCFTSKEAQFVTVYGRRRVGKTFLIREFFKKKKCHFFHATGIQGGKMSDQLEKFSQALSKTFHGGARLAVPRSWAEALQALQQEIERVEGKVVIFLDELPWMASPRSRLLQEIDYYWNNTWAGMPNIILVLCGSSSSWIVRKIIKGKGGFYKRTTLKLPIQPFSLSETRDFLKYKKVRLNDKHIVSLYMTLGGIPYYLNLVEPHQTAQKNVQRLFFDDNSPLLDEFNTLFDSLFYIPKPYKDIVRELAQHREGLTWSEIQAKVGTSSRGGSLTERLENLCFSGYLTKYRQWREIGDDFYKVTDEFCLFYLRWVEPHEGAAFDADYWVYQSTKPAYYAWSGYAFESVCRKHIHKILRALDIRSGAPMNPWRYTPRTWTDEDGAQIDLVVEQLDGAITLIEIKYTDKIFTIDKRYAHDLERKRRVFKETTGVEEELFLALVSANGVRRNVYSKELLSGIATLEDLFNHD